jgi:hypothetical protein
MEQKVYLPGIDGEIFHNPGKVRLADYTDKYHASWI